MLTATINPSITDRVDFASGPLSRKKIFLQFFEGIYTTKNHCISLQCGSIIQKNTINNHGLSFQGEKMKIYDISQEVYHCVVFPGDPKPTEKIEMEIVKGDICNLSSFTMCAHNGTHVDAPFHFYADGKRMGEMPLSAFIGDCYVAECEGVLTAEQAAEILKKAGDMDGLRILLKGKTTVSAPAAQVFADAGVLLIGNESQTVGPEDAPKEVHLILLGKEVVLLEGIRLDKVPEGRYLLNTAPINLGSADGAPCRAVLMDLEK